MLHQVATVNASMSISDALMRLADYPDSAFVVVRRQEKQQRYWYHFQVQDLRAHAHGADADTLLTELLNLHEYTSSETKQISDISPAEAVTNTEVILDGVDVVGFREPEPVAAATRSGSRGPVDRGSVDFISDDSHETTVTTSRFEAYPHLQAPDGIPFRTKFELTVGLTKEPPSVGADAIVVAAAPSDEFDLLVQVIAPGFMAPAGTQRWLHVNRAAPTANQVTFELIAEEDEPSDPRQHTLEAQFSFLGNACGRAWRSITLLPTQFADADVDTPELGSSPLTTPGASNAPDLTISITEADEDGWFVWLFTSPHPVKLHNDKQIETRLDNHNARSFATKVLKGVPGKDGTDQVGMHMTGASREIAQAMPTEFWQALSEVWAFVEAQDNVPRLLFLSAEPYVPWELASVEDDYIDPALLDSNYPKVLNAQTRVGRWLPPRPCTPRGGVRPTQPPATNVGVKQMAVVTGDYLAINGIRPLPEAKEEGKRLAADYHAVQLTATWDDIKDLLHNAVEQDGQQVDIELLHFACHGQVDLANPTFNGIVLNSGNMRLDATTARGNTIGKQTEPFAFLNACEVGMAGETLGSYGGFAAAFLNEGFRGFVAPLWAVNDELAHKIALDFYRLTFDQQQPVAEALRVMRGRYDPDAAKPSSTPLAYMFYGHPDLVLERQ